MIFSEEVKPESWIQKKVNVLKVPFRWIANKFKSQPDKSDVDKIMTPLNHSEAQEKSLAFYLASQEDKLKGLDLAGLNFRLLVNNIYHIYEQLYAQKVCCDHLKDEDWNAPGVAKVYIIRIII